MLFSGPVRLHVHDGDQYHVAHRHPADQRRPDLRKPRLDGYPVDHLCIFVSLVVAAMRVGAVMVPMVAGTFMERLGACRVLIILIPPTIAFSFVIAFVPSKIGLYVGRIGHGLVNGIINTAMPTLTAEITSPEIRGVLASVRKITGSLGMLAMYAMASFLPWRMSTVLGIMPLVPAFFLLFYVPESPYWLVKHNREEEALKGLARLRGPRGNPSEELEKIKKAISEKPSVTVRDQFRLMKKSENYKPIVLMTVITCVGIMGGQGIIFQYAVFLFKEAGVTIDEYLSTILVGVIRLIACIVSLFIIDLIDRRPLLIGSAMVCALSLGMTSICLMVPEIPRILILVFILLYVTSLTLGVSIVPGLVISELIPTQVRAMGVAICSNVSIFTALVSSVTFPLMMVGIGLEYSFVVFAVFNVAVGALFLTVPETRARSLNELQDVFAKKPKKTDRAPEGSPTTPVSINVDGDQGHNISVIKPEEIGMNNLAFVEDEEDHDHKKV
ncbi:trehalose transporter 1-like protein isoform X2 [Oratosquilla oratoria]|uniref:trehalose transporter 1-like protein isoform X2 n=1 Tax=Oratosquilla oratoria TaxID=337810 RepID=UPI003F771C5E